jgi:hypothetical protein
VKTGKVREESLELPACHIRADVGSFDADTNTIEVVFSTGATVKRYSWARDEYYNETLEMTPEAVRLGRLNAGAPLLDTHNSWSLDSVIGSVVAGSAAIRDGKGYARVKLSTAPADADRVAKIRDGVVRNVSVGYRLHRIERTPGNEKEGKIAEVRVVDWEPLEISAVPVPADPGAQFRGEEPQTKFPCVIVTREAEASEPSAAVAETEEQPVNKDTNAAAGERAADVTAQAAAAAQTQANDEMVRAAADAAVRAERERASAIREIAKPFKLGELADQHITAGTDVAKFREAVVAELAKRARSDDPIITDSRAEVTGPANTERRAAAIENALLHRAYPGEFKLTDDGRDFRGMSLVELARDALESAGIRTRGMSKMDVAQDALLLGQQVRIGGLMTTFDFPNILANVLNKTLRAGYEAAPQTFRPLITETSVPDFKPVSRVQLGEAPQLDKVLEHGEFKRGGMGEAAEQYSIATYGKIVGITRQVIVNDDLNAFTRIPRAFGVQAAQLESDLVWAQILGNPTMGDTVSLFAAAHNNLAGTGAVIGVDTVSAGRTAMAKQTGLDGKTVLNLNAVNIIVPVVLETAAEQFLHGTFYPTAPSGVVPQTLRSLNPISEPRLDNGIPRFGIAGSNTAWYLAANPGQLDLVELAYLEGNQGVYTETRIGFDIDGIEVKVRMDVGAKVIDWRGFYKNPGA